MSITPHRATTRPLQASAPRRRVAQVVAVSALVLLGGCATTLQQARGGPGQRLDPWENWNRKVFGFNEELDRIVLKPVATFYAKVVPQFVRRGVDNFFSNAADGWSIVNDLLQLKGRAAYENTVRFTTNTVFGFLGVIDIATEFGLDHQYEDFGQTLGAWGFGAGAYIVLPLLGPSSVRDTAALPLDRLASPALLIDNGSLQFTIVGGQIINSRANLLGASQVLDDIALDKYTFIRDAYLQRRRSLVYDGDQPDLPDGPQPAGDPVGDAAGAAVMRPGNAASSPAGAASSPRGAAPSPRGAASAPAAK